MKRIPPFRLVPTPLDDEARRVAGFQWADADVGKRHQLGGEPARAISDADWPRCADCRERMTFYGQLDSISDDICIADVGLIYVFLCFDCFDVRAIVDST
jgi:hypothetical protein